MQDSGIEKQRSIGKKKGGFLFASAPEKTPEDIRREEEERKRQEQEELERQLTPPIAPSNIPLATFGVADEEQQQIRDVQDDMATASSLKERLKLYQSLKAEQQNSSQNKDADPDSFLGPPINKPEETKQEETKDEAPPGMIEYMRLC